MSNKKKNKNNNDTQIPIDFQIESKNLNYTLSLKNNEIDMLKQENSKKTDYLKSVETELFQLKKEFHNVYKVEKELRLSQYKNEQLQKEIDKLNNEIIIQQKKFSEEKIEMEKLHTAQMNQMKSTLSSYEQKIEYANQCIVEHEQLKKQIADLEEEKIKLIQKTNEELAQKEVEFDRKFMKLREKMLEHLKQTTIKVQEEDVGLMDINTKLTMLQNHQLLNTLEDLSIQIDNHIKEKEDTNKKLNFLQQEMEIHKQVEVSLAEKNKILREEIKKIKEMKEKDNNEEENKDEIEEIKKDNSNKIFELEKKIISLSNKLNQKKKDFDYLKDRYDSIEDYIKNLEKKYSGVYNFLESSLNEFFIDDELISNKEVSLNIDNIKKGDFSLLNKSEKYSTLVILMKYMMPLISNFNDLDNQKNYLINNENINKVKLNYHFPKYNPQDNIKKINIKKFQFLKFNSNRDYSESRRNIKILSAIKRPVIRKITKSESLPSIFRGRSNNNYPSYNSVVESTSTNNG